MPPIDIRVGGQRPNESEQPQGREFLGIRMQCAGNTYIRLYKNKEATAYEGRCSQCLKPIRIGIGSGGTDARFFTYDCGAR